VLVEDKFHYLELARMPMLVLALEEQLNLLLSVGGLLSTGGFLF
jgi:hypothetical protein